jgi:hypothetical protein
VFRRRHEQTYFLAVSPLGLGVTFRVRHGHGRPKITWSYEPGVIETVTIAMTVERAVAEIEMALGYEPRGEFATERPPWMGSLTWTPPLPACPPHAGGS